MDIYYREGEHTTKMSQDVYFIYAMLDAEGKPFYIGKTNNIATRKRAHLSMARRQKNYPVYNKLRQLMQQGHPMTMVILEETDVLNCDERERYYIEHAKNEGRRLYNLTLGGEGGCTSASAMKGVETKRRNGTNKFSSATKAKMSQAKKGKPLTIEHKEALRKAWKRSLEQLAQASAKAAQTSKGKINIKRYLCIAPDGTEYITYQGLTIFCEQNGLSSPNMHRVLRGGCAHHKGWKIKHVEE